MYCCWSSFLLLIHYVLLSYGNSCSTGWKGHLRLSIRGSESFRIFLASMFLCLVSQPAYFVIIFLTTSDANGTSKSLCKFLFYIVRGIAVKQFEIIGQVKYSCQQNNNTLFCFVKTQKTFVKYIIFSLHLQFLSFFSFKFIPK